jgi:hypothetical protein
MSAMPNEAAADPRRLVAQLRRERDEALECRTSTSDVLNAISRSTAHVRPVLDTVIETAVRLLRALVNSLAPLAPLGARVRTLAGWRISDAPGGSG